MEHETYEGIFNNTPDERELKLKIPYIGIASFYRFLKSVVTCIQSKKWNCVEWEQFKDRIQRFPLGEYVIFDEEEEYEFDIKHRPFELRWGELTNAKRCFLVALMLENVWNTTILKPTPLIFGDDEEIPQLHFSREMPSVWEFVDIEVGKMENQNIGCLPFLLDYCWF